VAYRLTPGGPEQSPGEHGGGEGGGGKRGEGRREVEEEVDLVPPTFSSLQPQNEVRLLASTKNLLALTRPPVLVPQLVEDRRGELPSQPRQRNAALPTLPGGPADL
jgi:hypothetical protein